MSESNELVLDPEVEEEIDSALSDEDIIGGSITGGQGEEKIPVVEKWFPGEHEWQGKTIISKKEAKAHALSKNLAQAFPEIRPLEGFIESTVNDLEMLYTSVEGEGRKQHMQVLRSMFGAGPGGDKESQGLAMQLLTGGETEDE